VGVDYRVAGIMSTVCSMYTSYAMITFLCLGL
jgi:hypothetical protein